MKPCKVILIVILLFAVHAAFSQEMRIISGVMKDVSGEPLPGVNVLVKGTNKGTVTDIDGKYSITAPLGAILIYSFIGFINEEVIVTKKNSAPVLPTGNEDLTEKKSLVVFEPVQEMENEGEEMGSAEGTAVFTSRTPSYSVINPNNNWLNDQGIAAGKVNNIDFGQGRARINLVKDEYYRIPHVSYYTAISTEKTTRLPKIQNLYAQGRPINGKSQWFGPETGEILSWGPNIANLEYDGSNYEYYPEGRLVNKGTGNGKAARGFAYPDSAFRKGFTYINNLKLFLKTEKKEYNFMFVNRLNNGILPGTKSTGNIVDFKWKRTFNRFKLGSQLNFDKLKSNYAEGSPANTLVIASVFTSPSTFNLTEGQKASKAYKNKETWLTSNNLQRSFARGAANHPFWLLSNMRDREMHQSINGQVNLEYKVSPALELFGDIRYQHQESEIVTGYLFSPYGVNETVNISRNELLYSVLASSGARWNHYAKNLDINTSLIYDYYKANSRLKRLDDPANDASSLYQEYALTRTEQSVNWNTNLVIFKGVLFKMTHNVITNNRYHSQKLLYSPTLALGLNFHELFRFYGFVERAKLKANWGRNYSFVPLTWSYGKYNYQHIVSSDYYNTSFENEIVPDLGIHPERVVKKDIGAEFGFWSNNLSLDIDFYEHKTTGAIFPVSENSGVNLKNLATNRVRGIEAEILFHQRLWDWNNRSQYRLIFDRRQSVVLDLYNGINILALGGFSDVHTALVKGQPAGVIVGTAWKRNENGDMVIGNDGYPLVDENLKIIANPEPDFTIGFEATVFTGNFTTSVLVEYRKGGQVWNGTGNVLSYLGLSQKTVDGRKVLEYVFDGVKQDGSINTTPVDFANPSRPMEQNRWYRYGFTGVAEDAVEDASWFRIREISVAYKFRHRMSVNPEFSLFVRNPLLVTKYNGVDPNVSLWQKANTAGLDLFNMPSVSSLGISLKITL